MVPPGSNLDTVPWVDAHWTLGVMLPKRLEPCVPRGCDQVNRSTSVEVVSWMLIQKIVQQGPVQRMAHALKMYEPA